MLKTVPLRAHGRQPVTRRAVDSRQDRRRESEAGKDTSLVSDTTSFVDERSRCDCRAIVSRARPPAAVGSLPPDHHPDWMPTAVMSFGSSGRSRGEGKSHPPGVTPNRPRTGTPCDSRAPILDCSTRPFFSVTSPYRAALMPKMTPKTDLQALQEHVERPDTTILEECDIHPGDDRRCNGGASTPSQAAEIMGARRRARRRKT